MGKRPLEGLRVLEFAEKTAGFMCTAQLADSGAEVIQIESLHGTDARTIPPTLEGTSTTHMSLNRGKKSMVCDMSKPATRDIVLKLAKMSDIIVENFRPGVMDKLGLGYEDIKKVKPDIIYTSISGFGQTGPYSQQDYDDLTIQAMSGIMSVTGPKDGEWTNLGVDVADYIAGVYGAMGTVLAVINRRRTGEGCHLDISVLDSFLCLMEAPFYMYLDGGIVRRPIGTKHPQGCLFEAVPTSDGQMICCAAVDSQFTKFCLMLGLQDLQKDPRFQDGRSRRKNDVDLMAIIGPETQKYTTKKLAQMCIENGLPVGEINTVETLVEDEHVKYRASIIDVVDSAAGKLKIMGSPFKSSAFEFPKLTFSAQKGEHTVEVLRNVLGISEKEIEEIISA